MTKYGEDPRRPRPDEANLRPPVDKDLQRWGAIRRATEAPPIFDYKPNFADKLLYAFADYSTLVFGGMVLSVVLFATYSGIAAAIDSIHH